jgi:hypothetical protein
MCGIIFGYMQIELKYKNNFHEPTSLLNFERNRHVIIVVNKFHLD